MFIYWKDFVEASLSFPEPHKKNDNQNNNSQGKQTHSWMDLLAIIELHCWGFPGVTKYIYGQKILCLNTAFGLGARLISLIVAKLSFPFP